MIGKYAKKWQELTKKKGEAINNWFEFNGIKDYPKYCTEQDIKNIENFSEEKLEKAWKSLTSIIKISHVSGLSVHACVFCAIQNFACKKCEYGKIHGKCADDANSDFIKIGESGFPMYAILSKEFYAENVKE